MNNKPEKHTDWGSVLVFTIALIVLTGFMPSLTFFFFMLFVIIACCKVDGPNPNSWKEKEKAKIREQEAQAELSKKEEESKAFWEQYEKDRLAIANMHIDLNHKPVDLD